MQRSSSYKYLAGVVLLAFLFSANALSFGSHATDEMLQAVGQGASGPILVISSNGSHVAETLHHDHSDGGHGDSHNHSDCCDIPHSHDTSDSPAALTPASLASTPLRFFEPFAWTPLVFLDRFIPPQNHA